MKHTQFFLYRKYKQAKFITYRLNYIYLLTVIFGHWATVLQLSVIMFKGIPNDKVLHKDMSKWWVNHKSEDLNRTGMGGQFS